VTIAVHPAEPTPALSETLALPGAALPPMADPLLDELKALSLIRALLAEFAD